jgi:tetratricopeptide (TPR) repeat protein
LIHLIVQLYYKRAFAHQMLSENDHAIRDYSLFIRCANDKGANVLAKGFLSRGLVYESMQLMQKALSDIDKASKLTYEKNPYYEYCRKRISIAMSEKDDDEDNEYADIDHIIRLTHNEKENDDDEEVKYIQKHMSSEGQTDSLVTSDTDDVEYEKLFYDALLSIEKGNSEDALEKFKNAFGSTTEEFQKAENLFRQGLCYYELRDRKKAKELFEEALKHDSKHARAIFRLGMMQAADNQLKNAVKTLTSAYQCAPNHFDILHERANIYEKLGQLDKAMYDRRRAMQLSQSPISTIVTLEDRMRHLQAEILQKGESAARHFKIGWLQEAIHQICNVVAHGREGNQEIVKGKKQDNAKYKEAVKAYKAAIDTDLEHLCPEAHALLALFEEEQNDIFPAHDAFQKLFEILESFPDSILMWKSFVRKIRETNYWKEMGALPSERMLVKVQKTELNRKAIDVDKKSFGEHQNLLLFYGTLRVQLSTVLAAFALAGCNQEIIAHNLKGPYSR